MDGMEGNVHVHEKRESAQNGGRKTVKKILELVKLPKMKSVLDFQFQNAYDENRGAMVQVFLQMFACTCTYARYLIFWME